MTGSFQRYVLGAVFARARYELGHTQAQVAASAKWTQSKICRLEAGEAGLDILEGDTVANALGTSWAVLVKRYDRAVAFALKQEAVLDPVGMQALAVYAVAVTWRK